MTRSNRWMLGIAALIAAGTVAAGVRALAANEGPATTPQAPKATAADSCPFHRLMSAWCGASGAPAGQHPAAKSGSPSGAGKEPTTTP